MQLENGWLAKAFVREAVERLNWPGWLFAEVGLTFDAAVADVERYAVTEPEVRKQALVIAADFEAKARQIRRAVERAAGGGHAE